MDEGVSGARGVVFGIIATLLLFACVTLHELGHSVQAQAYGIGVKDITLLPIGGSPGWTASPRTRDRSSASRLPGRWSMWRLRSCWRSRERNRGPRCADLTGADDRRLAGWNLARVDRLFALRQHLARALQPHSRVSNGRRPHPAIAAGHAHASPRATRIAAGIGQAMALLLGFLGFATGNYFLILVAIFVWIGAGQESAQAEVRDVFAGAQVSQIMSTAPMTMSPGDPLLRAVQLTLSSSQADFPIVDRDGYVVGS